MLDDSKELVIKRSFTLYLLLRRSRKERLRSQDRLKIEILEERETEVDEAIITDITR